MIYALSILSAATCRGKRVSDRAYVKVSETAHTILSHSKWPNSVGGPEEAGAGNLPVATAVLRLCSVKSAAEAQSENWVFSIARSRHSKTLWSLFAILKQFSQAGRRGFDPCLQLHLFKRP